MKSLLVKKRRSDLEKNFYFGDYHEYYDKYCFSPITLPHHFGEAIMRAIEVKYKTINIG